LKEKSKKQANGYTIRTDRELNIFLTTLREQTKAKSIKELIRVMLKCPELPSFIFDYYRKTAFEITKETREAYEAEHGIKKIGMVKATYVKRKPKPKTLVLPKNSDIDVRYE